MAEIISCPSCQRKLQVPQEYFGRTVQCPECKQMFAAGPARPAAPQPASPPPLSEAGAPQGGAAWDEPEPKRPSSAERSQQGDDEDDDRPRRQDDERAPRRRFADDEDDYAERPRRRYVAPHRGGLVLTFGILGLIPCLGLIFGPLAWILGSADLAQIRAGVMDPDGDGLTQAGRILGIISTCLHTFIVGGCCLLAIIGAANARPF